MKEEERTMQKTLYDLDRLEQILEKTQGTLSEVEKAAYYAAANVLAQNLVTRWNELRFSAILFIEGEMRDLMWHMNTVLGFVRPVISLEEHYAKAVAKLRNTRRSIEDKRVVSLEYHKG